MPKPRERSTGPRVPLSPALPRGRHNPQGAVMISRVLSAELPERIGERVTIAGWLHRRRELKSVTFLIIRDRAGLAQVVLPTTQPVPVETAEVAQVLQAADLGEECVLRIEGLVVANVAAPGGAELARPVVTM